MPKISACSICSVPFRPGEPRVRGHRAQWHPACKPSPVGRKYDPDALKHRGKWMQVMFEPEVRAAIAVEATTRGISMSEYVRQTVGRDLAKRARP